MTQRGIVLVTGATGNVGRRLVPHLLAAGADVRALVRNPDTANLPDGVDVARGDLMDADSLVAALDGVESVFLLWPKLTADGASAVVETIAARVRRIVYFSASAVKDGRTPEDNGVWGQLEHAIEKAGVEWTFLRVGGLAVNTLGWAEQIRTDGVVRWTYGAAARSLIHEADIAAVAALALREDRHVGAKYVLTGPEALTQSAQVRLIGEAIGRPTRWEELPVETAREQMLAATGDPAFVDSALGYWATLVDDPEPVTRTVEDVTGVAARPFSEWARDHADDFGGLAAG